MRRLLIALLVIGYAPAADGQEMPVTHALVQIRLNSHVRVATPAGVLQGRFRGLEGDSLYVINGRLLGVESDPLYVTGMEGIQPISLAAVDTLWTRGGVAGEGVLPGALAGAVGFPMLFVGGMVAGLIPCDGCGLVIPTLLAAIVPPSAGLGAVVGAVVADARWRRIYPE